MRSLPLPLQRLDAVLSACLSGIDDPDLHARVTSALPALDAAAQNYKLKAAIAELHLVPRVETVGLVSKDELVALYANHLSATRGAARDFYDKIKLAAPFTKCPLCGVGRVAVLDHHLPKRRYPDLTALPCNLVPACHACNYTKGVRFPRTAGDQTLHPYFDDDLISTRWLKGIVQRGEPVVVEFVADPPSPMTPVNLERVRRHVRVCGLDLTFAANASDELDTLKMRLSRLGSEGGPDSVRAHLLERAEDFVARPNAWQLSFYEALAADDWFVNGGYSSIA